MRCCFRGKGQGLDRHTSASATMKVLEYRIVMPLTLEEVTSAQSPIATHLTPQYERGHLYSVCKSSRLETGKGEGFEFLVHSLPRNTASVCCLVFRRPMNLSRTIGAREPSLTK